MENKQHEYGLAVIYDYKQYPDKVAGRCNNCNHALFKSSIKNAKLIRECRNCGMKKSI